MIDDQFIKVWHPRYDDTESDEPEYQRLVHQVNIEMVECLSLTRQTFTDILKWKSIMAMWHIDWPNFKRYSDAIRLCHEASDIGKMKLLDDLRGIGAPVASTFLHFIYPSRFPIIDKRTAGALRYFGYIQQELTGIRQYPAFMVTILSLQDRHPTWSLREIDRAMFAFHKQNPEIFGTLSKPRTHQNQSEKRLRQINNEELSAVRPVVELINQAPQQAYSFNQEPAGGSGALVEAKVRGLGQYYPNGKERFEIHIAKTNAVLLGHTIGLPMPIQLQIGRAIFSGELRSTSSNKYLWISAKIYDQEGNRTTLVDALSSNGIVKNKSVALEAGYGRIRIVSAIL